jgi:hypothetical protein
MLCDNGVSSSGGGGHGGSGRGHYTGTRGRQMGTFPNTAQEGSPTPGRGKQRRLESLDSSGGGRLRYSSSEGVRGTLPGELQSVPGVDDAVNLPIERLPAYNKKNVGLGSCICGHHQCHAKGASSGQFSSRMQDNSEPIPRVLHGAWVHIPGLH